MPTPRTYIIASIAAACISMPAFAGSSERSQSVSVTIAGYDLSTQAGAAIVMDKIEAAAERVCGLRPSTDSLRFRRIASNCIANATEEAVVSIGSPTLERIYAQRTNPETK